MNREEWRDILPATNNKLDFDSISNALQLLWDEQLMQPRSSHHHGPQAYLNWVEEDNSWAWNDDSWWAEAQWNDVQPSWDADYWWQARKCA